MEKAAVLLECKKTLEGLDFTPCFMEHENFIRNPDGRVRLFVIDGRLDRKLGTQCPAHIQENRPHCNHMDKARQIMIDVIIALRDLGVLAFSKANNTRCKIRKIGGQQLKYDVQGREYIHRLPIDEFGTNPEMEKERCKQDDNRARLERINTYLIDKIVDALARLTNDSRAIIRP